MNCHNPSINNNYSVNRASGVPIILKIGDIGKVGYIVFHET